MRQVSMNFAMGKNLRRHWRICSQATVTFGISRPISRSIDHCSTTRVK